MASFLGNLFGFEITKVKKQEDEKNKVFSLPQNDDGAVVIQSGSHYGTYVDLDGMVKNEIELITRYREMAIQPELECAIDEIVNEAIVNDDNGQAVELNADDLKEADSIKRKINNEFDYVLKLLNFGNMGHEIFRRWYVDGRLHYHVVIDETKPKDGIKELRYIDPRRIRKIKEVQKTKDSITGMEIIKNQNEYYLYNERGIIGTHSNLGAKISVDSIVSVASGLMDSRRVMVLSFLHKAIKPLNNLRMVEDATVIYRLSRAPERRVFYIDVGNMPTVKADEYLRDIAAKYRNKLVYDSSTGEIKDDRKHLAMLEDFWLPRREGSKGTEITTLQGGMNLGELEDVKYFEKKLYKALSVPPSRTEGSQGFSLGRSNEITRDELKFTKFIQRLRNKFSTLFDELLRRQLTLKQVCTLEEWEEFKEDIWYDFRKDNNFNELKENELMTTRAALLQLVDPYVGRYYSQEWVKKKILHQTEEEIAEIQEQMDKEIADNPQPQVDEQGNPIPLGPDGQPMQGPAPNIPPPTPAQQMQQQAYQANQPMPEDATTKLEQDPLLDKKKTRFLNDTLEPV